MKHDLIRRYQKRYLLKPNIKLRGYQLKAASVGVRHGCYALLMAPRLGKTRVEISIMGWQYQQGDLLRWVIVCPKIAMSVWKDSLADTTLVPHCVRIISGAAEERQLMLKEWEDEPGVLSVLIINPEATWRLKKWLYKFNPDKITVDESHRIKNHSAKQSTTIHTLGRRAHYRSILTGTFMSVPTDAFSQYKFLEPSIFGPRWKDFLNRYVDKWGFGGFKPKTFKDLDDLQENVHSIAYVLDRDQAGGFPEEQEQIIKYQITGATKKAYREMEEELKTMVRSVEVSASVVLTQVLRLQQIASGFVTDRDPDTDKLITLPIGKDRLMALKGVLEEYPIDTPIVIFARFKRELDDILGLCKAMKRSSNYIRGGMAQEDREQTIKDFQSGKVDTCVVQIRAGGIAIDLSRAKDAIFYSTTGSYIDDEQSRSRIIARSGGKVSFIRLIAENTMDELALESIKANREWSDFIVKRVLTALMAKV